MINHASIKYFHTLCQSHPGLELLVVSKYADHQWIRKIHALTGWINFGENRIEALEDKVSQLKDLPIIWHYIGPLQGRKIERITRYADHIQSVSRQKDLCLIDGHAKMMGKRVAVWIQVNDSNIANRSGAPSDQVPELVRLAKTCEHIHLQGMMILPEKGDLDAYWKLGQLRQSLDPALKLSAGMSEDHLSAINHGSDLIRIGRALMTK
ncbi:alanine racemase [Gammaproteobacteria bacterium]|nr:alanine racemase [Gammaproteobacteria bacterium]